MLNEYRVMMLFWEATVRSLLNPHGRSRNETGAVSAEQVIITATLAAGAIVIGAIIVTKFTDKANTIPTGP